METWYKDITPHIDTFFDKLQYQVPGCEIQYIAISHQQWWAYHA